MRLYKKSLSLEPNPCKYVYVASCWASGFVKKGFVVPQEQIKDGRMD